jgi:hypothetical protein
LVLEQVSAQLGGITSTNGATNGKAKRKAAKKAQAPAEAKATRVKRTPEDISKIADKIEAYVRDNPGTRIDAVAKAIKKNTKELQLPVRKLIEEKRVRTEGQKRATEYHPPQKRKKAAKKAPKKATKKKE